jgi:hypothetical protein
MNDFRFFKKQKITNFVFVALMYEIGSNYSGMSSEEEKALQRKSVHFNQISLVSRNLSDIKAPKRKEPSILVEKDSMSSSPVAKEETFADNTNTFKYDLSNFIIEHGFDGDINQFKYVMFFSFEHCFINFQILNKKNYYLEFYDNIVKKFESISFPNNSYKNAFKK